MVTKTRNTKVVDQTITLASGRTFDLPWSPVEPKGQGAGKQWRQVSETMWKALFDRLHDYTTAERNEVMALYKRSYQSLHKVYGTVVPRSEQKKQLVEAEKKQLTPLEHVERCDREIAEHETAIAALIEERASYRDAAVELAKAEVEAMQAKIEALSKM